MAVLGARRRASTRRISSSFQLPMPVSASGVMLGTQTSPMPLSS